MSDSELVEAESRLDPLRRASLAGLESTGTRDVLVF